MIILSLIGIPLFLITLFVHKHTSIANHEYEYNSKTGRSEKKIIDKEKLTVPIWLLISVIIIFLVPVVNIIGFIAGAVYYLVTFSEGCEWLSEESKELIWDTSRDPKWFKKIIKFLNKEV